MKNRGIYFIIAGTGLAVLLAAWFLLPSATAPSVTVNSPPSVHSSEPSTTTPDASIAPASPPAAVIPPVPVPVMPPPRPPVQLDQAIRLPQNSDPAPSQR